MNRSEDITDIFTVTGDEGQQGLLTVAGDADAVFSSRPLAIVEGVVLTVERGLRMDRDTFEAIRRNAHLIKDAAPKAVNLQLERIIESERPAMGFRLLDMAGLLEIIFPEISALKGVESIEGHGHKDNFEHTLKVLDNIAAVSAFSCLRWVALVHDIGKPRSKKFEPGLGWTFRNHDYIGTKMVKSIFRRMKIFNPVQIDYISKIVGLHMRPQQIGEEGVTDSAVRRMKTDAGDADDLRDLMLLAEADLTSKNPVKVRRVLDTFAGVRRRLDAIIESDRRRAIPDLINGHEIMATFGIEPTPELGAIKARVCEYAAEKGLSHAEAYQYMLDIAPEFGLCAAENVEELRESFETKYLEAAAQRKEKAEAVARAKKERDKALGRTARN